MKYCSNCGASLADGAVSFCSECGRPLRVRGEAAEGKKKAAPVMHDTPEPPSDETTVNKIDQPAQKVKKTRPKKSPCLFGRKKPPRHEKPEPPVQPPEAEESALEQAAPEPDPDDGYDRYYEDILPIDEDQRTVEKLDPEMIKKVALIAGGALLIVIIAIVALMLM